MQEQSLYRVAKPRAPKRSRKLQRPNPPEFLSIQEFRARYGLGVTKVYALMNEGVLEAVKVGSKTLIRTKSSEKWAASLPARTPK